MSTVLTLQQKTNSLVLALTCPSVKTTSILFDNNYLQFARLIPKATDRIAFTIEARKTQ
jgi:hypothetical protein